LIGPSVLPPSTMDRMDNSVVNRDSDLEKCTSLFDTMARIIGRLKEGEHSIVLDLVLELVDHGRRFRCAALIDTGAMGLFISRNYTMHVQTQLHRLESPVTVGNVDGTKNRGGVIEFYVDVFLEAPDHQE
jgi:hypothetical protein